MPASGRINTHVTLKKKVKRELSVTVRVLLRCPPRYCENINHSWWLSLTTQTLSFGLFFFFLSLKRQPHLWERTNKLLCASSSEGAGTSWHFKVRIKKFSETFENIRRWLQSVWGCISVPKAMSLLGGAAFIDFQFPVTLIQRLQPLHVSYLTDSCVCVCVGSSRGPE